MELVTTEIVGREIGLRRSSTGSMRTDEEGRFEHVLPKAKESGSKITVTIVHYPPDGGPTLRVVFESPGRFLVDAQLTVSVDGDEIYSGSLGEGFDIEVETWPGTHRIYTCIANSLVERRRAYAIEVTNAPEQTIRLDYSRMWGNLTKDAQAQSV